MIQICLYFQDKPQLSIQMYKDALSTDFGYLLPLYNISLQYQKLGTIAVELECLSLLVTVMLVTCYIFKTFLHLQLRHKLP